MHIVTVRPLGEAYPTSRHEHDAVRSSGDPAYAAANGRRDRRLPRTIGP